MQVIRDSAKARREVAMHCKAAGCRNIVQVKDVYENKVDNNNCLLVVMEWYNRYSYVIFAYSLPTLFFILSLMIDGLMNVFVFVCSMEGGELFNRIQERADSAFTERGL